MPVTVVIVSWNSEKLLTKCLWHLERQTIKPMHVLVIDNASTDESVNNAEAFGDVTVHRMKSNLGFAAGNNHGLAVCDTEFIALLNPDAYPEPDWLERLIEAAVSCPDVAAFGSRQLCNNSPELLDGIGDCYHFSGLTWRDRHGSRQQACDLIPREIFSPCAGAALYRRQAMAEVGGFDEDYFCYVEDVDLGFRLRLAGHKAMYVPGAVVHHVGSATTGGQRSDFSVYHGHRNLVWTFVKNMPGALFWLLLPMHLALNVVTIFWFIARGQGKVVLRAKRDAINAMPKMWAKRRQIQSRRVAKVISIWRVLNRSFFP